MADCPVEWICDQCEALLNEQDGFSENCDSWKCTECGFVNRIDTSMIYLSEAEFLMLDVALLVRVTYTQIETMFGWSACDAYIIVGDKGCLENLVLPVGVCIPAGIIERVISLIGKLLAIQLFELRGIHHFHFIHYFLEAEGCVYIHQCLSFFRFLGGDDDNTAKRTIPVYPSSLQ